MPWVPPTFKLALSLQQTQRCSGCNSVIALLSGLDIDGLYRISGNLATIQKLRYKVDRGKEEPAPWRLGRGYSLASLIHFGRIVKRALLLAL